MSVHVYVWEPQTGVAGAQLSRRLLLPVVTWALLNSFTLSGTLLHRLEIPSFQVSAVSVGHVRALLHHLSLDCVLLHLGASSLCGGRGLRRDRWQKDHTAERSSLQEEAEPGCP